MADVVFVQGLEARAVLGVGEEERQGPQTVRRDLEIACAARAAAAADDLRKTVDYHAVSRAVLAHVESSRHRLVETVAERVAELIRREFGAPWVRVRVTKTGAVRFTEAVGVVVERGTRPS
jgi:dihydroneopterin aldolase